MTRKLSEVFWLKSSVKKWKKVDRKSEKHERAWRKREGRERLCPRLLSLTSLVSRALSPLSTSPRISVNLRSSANFLGPRKISNYPFDLSLFCKSLLVVSIHLFLLRNHKNTRSYVYTLSDENNNKNYRQKATYNLPFLFFNPPLLQSASRGFIILQINDDLRGQHSFLNKNNNCGNV